ncbi:tetratricopeptide repeat protein 28-like isoform X1 [Branchiostoma floridae]|uniref:Tetratricopeptide repeat protein 28-like isoform X1 n=1 Tax=Branchiostoma floridae TaxID=7739 RepID=A0A9J7LPA8_BRAFL|nr:tetratricopeptide repeat protein 28-like isoform X1 [Branchiostoma floridae]
MERGHGDSAARRKARSKTDRKSKSQPSGQPTSNDSTAPHTSSSTSAVSAISEDDKESKILLLQAEGDAAFHSREYHQAVDLYSKALDLQSDVYEIRACRTAAYIQLEDYRNAEADAQQLISFKPKLPQNYYLLAISQAHQDRHEEALGSFLQCMDLDPEHRDQLMEYVVSMAAHVCRLGDSSVHKFMEMKPVAALHELGQTLHYCGLPALCVQMLESALRIPTEDTDIVTKVYLSLGDAHTAVRQGSKAKFFYEQCLSAALKADNVVLETKAYVNLASLCEQEGQVYEAIMYYIRLLTVGDDIRASLDDEKRFRDYWSTELERGIHLNLSIAYKKIRQFSRALHHGKDYMQLIESSNQPELMKQAHYHMATLYEAGQDYKQALAQYNLFLSFCKEAEDEASTALAHGCLGNLYASVCDYKQALLHHEEQLDLMEKEDNEGAQMMAHLHLAEVLIKTEEFEDARVHLQESLQLSRELDQPELECRTLLKLGDLFSEQGRHQHALYYYEQAQTLVEDEDQPDLHTICQFHVAHMSQFSTSLKELETARRTFEELIPIYEDQARRCDEEEVQLPEDLGRSLQLAYDGMLSSLSKLGNTDQALEYTECHRRQNLLWTLNVRPQIPDCSKLFEDPGSLANLVGRFDPLKIQQLFDIVNVTNKTVLYYSVVNDSLLLWVLQPGKGVARFYKSSTKENFVEKCRGCIALIRKVEGQSSPCYDIENRSLPRKKAEVYEVKKANLRASQSKKEFRKELEEEVEESSKKMDPPRMPFKELYNVLIAPVEDLLSALPLHSDLVIIPDKDLLQVPFDLLKDFKQRCLCERFQITIVSCLYVLEVAFVGIQSVRKPGAASTRPQDKSLIMATASTGSIMVTKTRGDQSTITYTRSKDPGKGLLEIPSTREGRPDLEREGLKRMKLLNTINKLVTKTSTGQQITTSASFVTEFRQLSGQDYTLVVGNPTLPQVSLFGRTWKPFQQLNMADKEASKVADYLGTEALTGEEATKEMVMAILPAATVVHIATFGSWEEGILALSPNPDHLQDGPPAQNKYILTADDILNQKVSAKLVVLSGCHGDDFSRTLDLQMKLPTCLLAAGAKCVLTQMWPVPNIVSSLFYHHFYQALQKNARVTHAMKVAKDKVKADDRFSAPVYWCTFVLIGQDVEVDLGQIKRAMLDQTMDKVEDVEDLLNPKPLTPEAASKETLLYRLQACVSVLLSHSREHPDTVPTLLQMIGDAIDLLDATEYRQPPVRLPDHVVATPGALPLLSLLGFDFQPRGAHVEQPYILFPHWNQGKLLLPSYESLTAAIDIISNHQCTQCISEILPTTEDILCQLIDMLSLTLHSPELQLRVGDTGVQPLWARGSATRRLLSALGFLQVGPLLVFNKVASNRVLLTATLHMLCAMSVTKSSGTVHKLDVSQLATSQLTTAMTRETSMVTPAIGAKVLPSLRPVLLPRNQLNVSATWMSEKEKPSAVRHKLQLSQQLQGIQADYRRYMSRTVQWHSELLTAQANESLAQIGKVPPNPDKVKVIAGATPSMERTPVDLEPTLDLEGVEQRRDYSNYVLHRRCENIADLHRDSLRKLYLPFLETERKTKGLGTRGKNTHS